MSKIPGIDLGTKRIGLAISNIERSFAFPLKVLDVANLNKTMGEAVNEIIRISKEEKVSEIVIGESKNYKGVENPIMIHVHAFKKALVREGFKVHLESELLTSAQAERFQGKIKLLDASSATIILQSFLDRPATQV